MFSKSSHDVFRTFSNDLQSQQFYMPSVLKPFQKFSSLRESE